MKNGTYLLTEYIVNQQHGSAFDEWVRMGAVELTTQEDLEILKGRSQPYINKLYINVSNNQLNYDANLEPHEVRLLEFSYTTD